MPLIFRVLDIETIPDVSTWGKHDQITWRLAPGPRSLPDGETLAAVEPTPSFPPPQAHRVVAISHVDILFDPERSPKYALHDFGSSCRWAREPSSMDHDESCLLSEFGRRMSPSEGSVVHLVSWNGRTFDLPVILLRSFKHKIACKWYYDAKDVRYRYSAEGHLDLMDYLADFGAVRNMSLADACHLAGLPGKLDMTGASVENVYRQSLVADDASMEKAQADVARYCLQDSIQTALLFVRSRYHIGKVCATTHNAILDTFSSSPAIVSAISLDWDRLRV